MSDTKLQPNFMEPKQGITTCHELMTMDECIEFLRIPEISKSGDHKNVIKNLIRFRHLPRIRICQTLLFPRQAVLEWIGKETIHD